MNSNVERQYGYFLILPFIGVSFYFHSIGVAIFPLLATAAAILYLNQRSEQFRGDAAVLMTRYRFALVSICLMCLYSGFVSAVQSLVLSLEIRMTSAVGLFFGMASFAAINLWESHNAREFNTVLRVFLMLILGFFFFQFVMFTFGGVEIDYLVSVTGEEQRLVSHQREVAGLGMFRRSSGLFAEPAVHAFYVVAILSVLLYRGACGVVLFTASVVSVVLSFSVSGIALLAFPLMVAMVRSRKLALWITVVALAAAVYFADVLYSLFEQEFIRLQNPAADASGADRLRFIYDLLENGWLFMFGYGLLLDVREILPPTGFIASAIYAFGLFGTITLLAIFFISVKGRYTIFGGLLLFALGLMLNFSVTSVFFWSVLSVTSAGFTRAGARRIA